MQKNKIALFLDRDGVINQKLPNAYVRHTKEFKILEGVAQALDNLRRYFHPIVVVTNQQGIGKGLMSEQDLAHIHQTMQEQLQFKFDAIYHAPNLAAENSSLRKPNIGMAHLAQKDFPSIVFDRSLMVGDSLSDLEFGRKANMKTVFIGNPSLKKPTEADFVFDSLSTLSHHIEQVLKLF